ncbi:efflux RND transporter permease subunit [Paenibacillus kobensis]|uniref:efflux RND transporter permease subunit n=1 Tax=Paenibacillus kobensis TaxID=59841 RepID=UPI000FD8520A|nr:efflux RND transporter permease subunit [Paenibacillus kobensis]
MKWITHFSIRNPVAIVLLVLLIAVGGVYSATTFKQEQLPEVAIPGIIVSVVYPGAAPNEVLDQVTFPLEKVLRNVNGVKNVTSQSANSVSQLMLEFSYNDNMKDKQDEVEKALEGIVLPAEAEKPSVSYQSTSSDPILYSAVSSANGMSEEELNQYVSRLLLPTLQSIEGVSEVQSFGLKDDGVYIRLDAGKMNSLGITFDQVLTALQANNLNIPLGETTMQQSKLPVFVQGSLRSIEQLKQWRLTPSNKSTLADIAEIASSGEQGVISITNGKPSITLNIKKSSSANTVEVVKQVREAYDEAQQDSGVQALIMYDSATDIKNSVNSLAREGALGALFASVLILFFLRSVRATLIAIVSIPLSILIALICLHAFTNVTLNIMTLGGLAVATGRVVDDSIVVIENFGRRFKGMKVTKELILTSTAEVSRAIASSTITTVAVFAPLGLLSGIVGEFFRPFALTVVFALLSSLLVALTVVPLMAWALMRRSSKELTGDSAMSRIYKRVLHWSLAHKAVVLIFAVLLFFASIVPIAAGAINVVLLPQSEYKYVIADFRMPRGTDINALKSQTDQIDAVIRQHSEVTNSTVTIGGGYLGSNDTNLSEWFIIMDSKANRDQVVEELESSVPVPEGSEFMMFKGNGEGGGAVEVTVSGRTADDVREATEQVTEAVAGIEGLDNISNNLRDGTKGIAIEVRQDDAAANGLSAAQASSLLRPYLSETKAGRIADGEATNELYVTLGGASLASTDAIGQLLLPAPDGRIIKVSDIADVREVQLPSTIQQKNGSEYASVLGKITDKNANKVNKAIKNKLDQLDLPAGTTYSIGGSNTEVQQMISEMLMAMLIAVGMVYIVMVVTFREGRAPLAVLFSLPFALIGGLVGTLVSGDPLSVSSMIGFLMLIGIVVTNAIVLVERVQQQIEHGLGIREALIEAGGTRLRPILMTAIATICALSPLAIGMGGGSIISSGLAVVVIGGLTSSTLLTLVVVPVMYELMYYRRSRKQRAMVQPAMKPGAAV